MCALEIRLTPKAYKIIRIAIIVFIICTLTVASIFTYKLLYVMNQTTPNNLSQTSSPSPDTTSLPSSAPDQTTQPSTPGQTTQPTSTPDQTASPTPSPKQTNKPSSSPDQTSTPSPYLYDIKYRGNTGDNNYVKFIGVEPDQEIIPSLLDFSSVQSIFHPMVWFDKGKGRTDLINPEEG